MEVLATNLIFSSIYRLVDPIEKKKAKTYLYQGIQVAPSKHPSKSGIYFAAAFNTDASAAKGTELTGADSGLPNGVTHCSKVTEAWTGATLRPFSRGGSVHLNSIASHGVAFVRMEDCT